MNVWAKLDVARHIMPKDATLGDMVRRGFLTVQEVHYIVASYDDKGRCKEEPAEASGGFLFGYLLGGMFR